MSEKLNYDNFSIDGMLNEATSKEELGITDYVVDGLMGVPRGIENVAQDVWNLADGVGEWVGEKITGEEVDFLPDYTENFLGESKTGVGQATEALTEFATLFLPMQGAISATAKGVGTISRVAKVAGVGKAAQATAKVAQFGGLAAGAAADAIMMEEGDQTLSGMAKEMGFDSALTDYLAVDGDDSLVEKKLKAAVEGAVVGGAFELVGRSVISPIMKSIRKNKAYKAAVSSGMQEDDIAKILDEHKFTEQEVATVKKVQQHFIDEEAKVVKLIKETPDIEDAATIYSDMNYTIKSSDKLAIAQQNYKNVIDVNKQLEDVFYIAKTGDEIGRDALVDIMEKMVDLKEVTSLQGKSLQALKGQAAARKGIAQESSELIAMKQTLTDIKKMSETELDVYRNAIASVQTPSDLRKFLNESMSKVPVPVSKKLGYAVQEMWKNGLLSGTGTWALNASGNAFTLLHQPFKRTLTGILKGDTAAIRGALREFRGLVSNSMASSKFALKAFSRNFKASRVGGIIDSSSAAFIDGSSKAKFVRKWSKEYIGSNAVGTAMEYMGSVVNLPLTLMGSMDEGFKQLAVRSRLEGSLMENGLKQGLAGPELEKFIAKNMGKALRESGEIIDKNVLLKEGIQVAKNKGITKNKAILDFANKHVADNSDEALEGMKDDLISYARRVTFQDDLVEGTLSSSIAGMVNKHQLGLGWVLPFVKTPLNVLRYSFNELMPLRGSIDMLRKEMSHADIAVKAEAQARFATSTTILGSAVGLANMGVITGSGPENPGKRANLMATGWRPYSIKIGDTYYSYSRMDPLALPIGVVADMSDRYRSGSITEDDGNKILDALIVSLTSNFKSKSYLQGITNLMSLASNAEDGRDSTYLANQFVGSFVPSIVAQGASMIKGEDPAVKARGIFDSMLERIGFDEGLEIRRNILGEEIRETDAPSIWGSKLLPTTISKQKKDRVMDEVVASGVDTKGYGYKVDGVDLREIAMPDGRSAYSHYLDTIRDVKIGGKDLRQQLGALISSKAYQSAPADPGIDEEDSLRARQIKSVLRVYQRRAKFEMSQNVPEFADKQQLRRDLRHQVRSGKKTTVQAIQSLLNPEIET
jgi:hypothetical protein